MSLPKIVVIVIVVILIGAGVAAYLWSTPGAYAPSAPGQSEALAPSPSAPSEEQELSAIPVDDLGTEMQDIDAELAK